MNGNDAMENLERGRIAVFYPQNGGREGLYINIETALIYLFGPEPWLLRLPAAVFGILTVWGVYLLAAELFSAPIGLLACFFIATSFWHVLFSRLGLRAIGAPLFAVWTLYLLLDAMRRSARRPPCQCVRGSGGFGVRAGILHLHRLPDHSRAGGHGLRLLGYEIAAQGAPAIGAVHSRGCGYSCAPGVLFHRASGCAVAPQRGDFHFQSASSLRRIAVEYPENRPNDIHPRRFRLAV